MLFMLFSFLSCNKAEQPQVRNYDRAIEIIKESEGLELESYYDPAGVLTIGYGTTGHRVYVGMKITEEQALEWLMEHLMEADGYIDRYVKVPINNNQRNALISFIYNVGVGNFRESTLLRKLNMGDYEGAGNEFKRWKYGGGKVLNGLVKRREVEAELFNTPIEGRTPIESTTWFKLGLTCLVLASIELIVIIALMIKIKNNNEKKEDDTGWWH